MSSEARAAGKTGLQACRMHALTSARAGAQSPKTARDLSASYVMAYKPWSHSSCSRNAGPMADDGRTLKPSCFSSLLTTCMCKETSWRRQSIDARPFAMEDDCLKHCGDTCFSHQRRNAMCMLSKSSMLIELCLEADATCLTGLPEGGQAGQERCYSMR